MNDLVEITKNTIEKIKQANKYHKIKGKLVLLPSNTKAVIIGDIHGDLTSLEQILKQSNWKQDKYVIIFLGDYIDRGPEPLKVLFTVFQLLNTNPRHVIPLRGNHEAPKDLNFSPHDFPLHLKKKYGRNWMKAQQLLQNVFDNLFTATIIENKALLLHGGIPTQANGVNDIAFAHKTHPETSTLTEILWNDPSTIPGVQYSFRGKGKLFGDDITSKFLYKTQVQFLIRGHQSFEQGYYWYSEQILTLFSCKLPIYQNSKAAYIKTDFNQVFTKKQLSRNIYQI
jgi:predicted phosphodiesterase